MKDTNDFVKYFHFKNNPLNWLKAVKIFELKFCMGNPNFERGSDVALILKVGLIRGLTHY